MNGWHPVLGLVVARSVLESGDVQRWAGVQTTTPLRTAFDIARRPPLFEAVVGIDAMLAARLVTASALARLESRLRLVLIAGGLPWPVTQHEVFAPDGEFVARLDLAYPRHRLGIEYEGDHHRSRRVYQQDLRRINALNACGWTVLRFGAADVYRKPRRVIEVARTALAASARS